MKALLPYWNLYMIKGMTDDQLLAFAITIYVATACFIVLIGLGIYITLKYLLRKGNKIKMQLLIIFYTITIVLSIFRIFFMLCFPNIIEKAQNLILFLPVYLQYDICILQCWMMLELSLRMRQTIFIMQRRPNVRRDSLTTDYSVMMSNRNLTS